MVFFFQETESMLMAQLELLMFVDYLFGKDQVVLPDNIQSVLSVSSN